MSTAQDRLTLAVLLRSAMDRRQVNKVGLAEAIGSSPSAIYGYRQGRYLPTVQVASRLADALLDQRLLETVVRLRTRICAVCSRPTVDVGTKPRVYCSVPCQRLAVKGVSTSTPPDPRDTAIATMCLSCEPDGICRVLACPLRAVSPLPFVASEDISLARPGIVWTEARRAATGARLGLYWSDPHNRANQSNRVRKYDTEEARKAARRLSSRNSKRRSAAGRRSVAA